MSMGVEDISFTSIFAVVVKTLSLRSKGYNGHHSCSHPRDKFLLLCSFRAPLLHSNTSVGVCFLLCVWLGIGGGIFRIAVQDDRQQQAATDDNGHDDVLGCQKRKVIGVGQSSQGHSSLHGHKTVGKYADYIVRQKATHETYFSTVRVKSRDDGKNNANVSS